MKRALRQWREAYLFDFPILLYPNGVTIVRRPRGNFCGGILHG